MPSFRVNQPPQKSSQGRAPKPPKEREKPAASTAAKQPRQPSAPENLADPKPSSTFRVNAASHSHATSNRQRKRINSDLASQPAKNSKPAGPRPFVRILFVVTLVSFLALAVFAYFRFSSFKESTFGGRDEQSLLDGISAANQTTAEAGPTPDFSRSILVQRIEKGERFSLLVLGYGGPGHDGPYLTDTIMQIVYDPTKKMVSLINIPRDLFVQVPFAGENKGVWTKINQAFSIVMNLYDAKSLDKRYNFQTNNPNSKTDAAAILAKDTVEHVTGIPVDYWVAVNFDGFVKLIDAIGGVTINVEKAFDDYNYNRNPGVNDGRNYLHFDPGVQLMSGVRAINYVRSRYSQQEQGDISRSRRQMKVIQAVKEQVLKPDILLKVPGALDALQGNLRTSVSFEDVVALAYFLNSSEGRDIAGNLYFNNVIIGFDLLNNANSPDAGFIFQPKAGQGNYSEIKKWIQTSLETAPPTPTPANSATPVQTPTPPGAP